jgi:hypothetical protein
MMDRTERVFSRAADLLEHVFGTVFNFLIAVLVMLVHDALMASLVMAFLVRADLTRLETVIYFAVLYLLIAAVQVFCLLNAWTLLRDVDKVNDDTTHP